MFVFRRENRGCAGVTAGLRLPEVTVQAEVNLIAYKFHKILLL